MQKYWYFVAIVIFSGKKFYYSGHVASKSLFPINAAELQSMDYVDVPKEYDKRATFEKTLIVNQVEVDEEKYETWKKLKGFT